MRRMTRRDVGFSGRLAKSLACSACLFFVGSIAVATADEASDSLAKMAVDAKAQFSPITAEKVAQAKAELVAQFGKLDAVLQRSPADNRDAWNETLMNAELRAQLAAETPDMEVLGKVLGKYQSDKKRMEWSLVQSTRFALRHYLNTLVLSRDEKIAETYASQLDELSQKLTAYAAKPDAAEAQAIGRTIGWLRRARQAPELVSAIDKHFSKPNLQVHVSKQFLSAAVDQDVEDTMQMSDFMLGATIEGTVQTQARATIGLVSSDSNASFDLQLTGNAFSNNIAYKGPVAVFTTGVTSIDAHKRLWLDESGLHADPASASCATSSQINDIQAKCNLIRKLAWKQATKSKPKAESIASRKAEDRVASRVDEQAAEMLTQANEAFVDRFRNPLLRRGGLPRLMQFSTTGDQLRAVIAQIGDANLAAPTDAPAIAGDPDLAVRLHQSFVGNLSEAYIGGVTLTDERLVEMLEEAKREVPEELKITADKDPWSITFAAEQPISASFSEEGISIAIHGRRFTRGDQEIRTPMRIRGTYQVEKTPEGSRLVRKGDVEVEYVGLKGKESVTQVAFKTFVRRKFEAMFKSPIEVDVAKLPERMEKAGKMTAVEIDPKAGWLSLGWKLQPREAAKTARVD